MKTLQILPSLDVGGVERGVIDLARAVKSRGDEIIVISSGGPLVAQLHKLGVTHYTLPVHKKSLFSLYLVNRIAAIIRQERVDVVHARSRVPGWLAWLACRKTQTPFVTTCHGYYSNHMLSSIMGWGKRVIVISRIIGRHMIDDFRVSPDRIRLIHRGIDLTQFQFHPDKYLEKKTVLRIVNIGRLSPIKGQIEFLKAVHRLRYENISVEVLIVGSEGKGKTRYTAQIEETIKQLGLSSCVKLTGTRRDIPEILAEADLLVLSTLVPEAFGRVIVEAGAVGTAVIATRVGGVLDIIDDGKNGLLVHPGDVDGLSKAMAALLKNPELCRSFAQRLRTKIEINFSLNQMVEKTLAVYREVKNEKKILIFKLGAMGDVVLATPSFRMIRERYPNAFISLIVDKKISSAISACPYLNEIIPVDRKKISNFGYMLKLAKKIRNEGFDLSVDLQNSKWTHMLAFLGAIPVRTGFRRGRMGFLLNRADTMPKVPEAPVKNQFRVLSKAGIKNFDDRLEMWPEAKALVRVKEALADFSGGRGPLTGFVVGSSPKWPSKRWPAEYFKTLASRLHSELDCRVVLIGSSLDHEIAGEITGTGSSGHILDMTGKTTSSEMVALIKEMNVIVSGDTAPLHIAAALGIRIVALFGPTDPRRHMPPADHATVLVRHIACQPCYKGECRIADKLACLRKISVDDALEAVKKHLSSPQTATASRSP